MGKRHITFAARAITLLTVLWAGVGAGFGPSTVAQASASANITSLRQEDIDRDGEFDLTVLEGAFMTSFDRVLVFDGGDDMPTSQDWRLATDFKNDAWVFDAGADGSAELVIQFVTFDGWVEARLFDDADGDGRVSYLVGSAGGVIMSEARDPSVIVRAVPDWFRPDGSLNYQLMFLQDGGLHLQEQFPELQQLLKRDGRPDFEYTLVDENNDGVPDYTTFRLLAEVPRVLGVPRFGVQRNVGQGAPRPSTASIFWPLLGRDPSDRLGNYFETMPTIAVDWSVGRIVAAGQTGYPIEHGYHINSLKAAIPGARATPNFENMMAFYDLSNDHDRYPELHIRHRYYEPEDIFGEQVSPALNEIRYSWTERNPDGLFWDYKLGLAGRYVIASTVNVGPYALGVVPFEDLPAWVVSRPWEIVTFVASEANAYASSEGIYEWAPIEDKSADITRTGGDATADLSRAGIESFIRGGSVRPPHEKFTGMRVGYRGEYSLDYRGQPRLYFSRVDRRLHLLGAERGLWQVSARSELRYRDLNGDGMIDQWVLNEFTEQGQLNESRALHVTGSHLVLDTPEGVMIRRAATNASVFSTLPPTNPAEWASLRNLLEEHERLIDATNLQDMLNQFPGPTLMVHGATLRDFRQLDDDGFRFVLDLAPGWTQEGAAGFELPAAGAGTFVAAYDGRLSLEPLRPAHLVIQSEALGDDGRGLEPNVNGLVRVSIRNEGLEDVRGAELITERRNDTGEYVELDRREVAAPAGKPTVLNVPWPGAAAGNWDVRFSVQQPEGTTLADLYQNVRVAPYAIERRHVLTAALGEGGYRSIAAIPLLAVAVLAGLLVTKCLAGAPRGEVID